MFGHWVIDATMGVRGGLFCFCPVELGDNGEITSVVTGMNYLAATPPGKLIAIVHEDGQDAVEDFCRDYQFELGELVAPGGVS